MVNKARRIPLIVKESAVPICSAKVPNGTALKGIIPKVIIEMLMVRPRISGSALVCTIVMLSDIYKELVNPIKIRKGIAIVKEVSCANIAKLIPQATEAPSITIPLLGMFPIDASRSVPIVAPMPINISKIPKPSDSIASASLAHAGIRAMKENPNMTGINDITNNPRSEGILNT